MKITSGSNWKLGLAFGSAILAMLAVGAISNRAQLMSLDSDRWVRHTHEVLESLQDLLSAMKGLESSARGFVLTGKDSYLASYREAILETRRDEDAFGALTADNPSQQLRLRALGVLIEEKIQRAELVIGVRQASGLEAGAAAIRDGPGQTIMSELDGAIEAARREEQRLLSVRRRQSESQSSETNFLLIAGTLLGAMIAAGAGWSVLRENARRRFAETSLRDGEERFRDMANNISQLAWMADEKGAIFWYNQRWYDYTGTVPEEMTGWGWQKVHDPDHVARVTAKITHCFQTGEEWEDTFPLLGRDGEYRWFLSRAVPIRDAAGKVVRWFGTNTDITEARRLEGALFEERDRAQVTLNSIGDAVACTDISGKISFLNPVAERMTGWGSQEAVGKPMADVLRIIDSVTRQTIPDPMEKAAAKNRASPLPPDCLLIRRDGFETPIEDSVAPIHERGGQVSGAVIVFRDVSAARATALQMIHSAQHDFLTGLPNRMLLKDRLGQAIASAPRHNKKVAVLFLDLDGFKHINDSLGHSIGDKLLQSIANRLVGCVRASDTVSRQGGDEFIALLSEVERAEDAAALATRMLEAVAEAHSVEGHKIYITTSIGISIYPEDGVDADTLIKNADTAMYQAKESGRQSFRLFKSAMSVRAVERRAIEENLRRALERREFELHYQPKVNLQTGEITGAEALIRWTHPVRGQLSPAQFMPIAEECGLILPIGAWVLREACKQARAWVDAGLPAISMAVNVSATEFRANNFLGNLFATLKETGLDPASLELELTEGVLMKHGETTEAVLRALRAKGVKLAIDDFGAGYSSLSHLRKFPIDALKIDRSFVRQLITDSEDRTIVMAVIAMARSLNLRVVAKGVETQAQLGFLRDHQCDEAQGSYLSPPVRPQQFARRLKIGISQTVFPGRLKVVG